MRKLVVFSIIAVAALVLAKLGAQSSSSNILQFEDPAGVFATIIGGPPFPVPNAFFQSLGTNGRSCATCHVASDAWTIVPAHVQQRFSQTLGLDPLFRTNDGTTCAGADVSTRDKAAVAYSLLLNKGLIRVQRPIPAGAEYTLVSVDDPYHCAPIPGQISVYRRPLPATNLKFLSSVMWDNRETFPDQSMLADLAQQAIDATLGHAQALAPPNADIVNAIVAFEMGTFTAQKNYEGVGLDRSGGLGGPEFLSSQPFFIGINDPGQSQFDPQVFQLFAQFGGGADSAAKASIQRGEAIFNTRSFTTPAGRNGTCSGCHDAPNSGNHSVAASLSIGVADAPNRTQDMPLFTFYCPALNQTIQTTDPGSALTTGRCADIGKFKVPSLRALSARAPYFHDGSAASLNDVVEFYDNHFQIGLSVQEKADLVAFLGSL